MDIQIVNPITYPGWDDLVLSTPGHSFFHSSSWARVLSESYGYTPLYFTVIENGNLRALVPVMEVNSFLTGRRGVSLPFTDYCEPIVDEGISFRDLFDQIIDYGKKRDWKYIELRGGSSLFAPDSSRLQPPTSNLAPLSPTSDLGPVSSFLEPRTLHLAPVSHSYLGHTLNLTNGEERIFSSFRESAKRNVRKALREGVGVEISNSLESVEEFYKLNCLTRREHGLPPQPYHFFEKILQHIISRGLGFVALASRNDQNIAGGVFFHFGERAIYKYWSFRQKVSRSQR